MKKILLALLVCACASIAQAGTYTAATCNQSDVNAVVNGPTHVAVDGDIIQVPAGSCTWTSGVTVPANIGIQVIGAGSGSTTITDNISSGALFTFRPQYGNSLSRFSGFTLAPSGTTARTSPIQFLGTCTSSGCPNLRMDNNVMPSSWESVSLSASACIAVAENMFGVLDHNTVGDSSGNATHYFCLVEIDHSSWQGVGSYGDRSWASADTFGTNQEIYLENNDFWYTGGTDTGGNGSYTGTGGGRYTCRFNTWHVQNNSANGPCNNHGTESLNRPRGGRQSEFYGNTVECPSGTNCVNVAAARSGPIYAFGNTSNSPNTTQDFLGIGIWRASTSMDFYPWSGTGLGPYDVVDGGTATSSSTLTSVSGTCTYNSCTLTDTSQSWTTNQFAPGSKYYRVYDVTSQAIAGIVSNTADALTLSFCGGNGTTCYASFSSGDTYYILGETLYASGTATSSSATLTDTSQSWTTNQWAGYDLVDTTQGFGLEIASNTSDTITVVNFNCSYINYISKTCASWNSGDSYIIVRASTYIDNEARSGGLDFSGSSCGSSATVPTCGINGAVNQTLDPSYEFADVTIGASVTNAVVSNSATQQANRDYYGEVSQSAQSSSSSPFNGTSGTGYGTLAHRPSTCTTGVGYWATDQGNWNSSGANLGQTGSQQGELFLCTATNTWTLSYTPYTYPHPLTQNIPVAPPSGQSLIAMERK
jgi:hypothetical protein